VVNHRYEHLLPTVSTINLPIREIRDVLGDRIASRLAETTERAVLIGPDRRRRTTT
jgi:DNA replication protein DnaC